MSTAREEFDASLDKLQERMIGIVGRARAQERMRAMILAAAMFFVGFLLGAAAAGAK